MLKMVKELPNNLHGGALYKISKFVLTKKVYQYLTTISVTKVWSGLKINWQGSQLISCQFFTEIYDLPSRSHKITKLTKISGKKNKVGPLFTN